MALISIILPTFNSAATLSKCLEGVLEQSFTDIEILVQDGGSTDETKQIVEAAAAKSSVIRWISEKDAGIYDAMNKAIHRATGEWIYFLGSDDYLWDNQVLSDVATELKRTDADLVYGDPVLVSDGRRHPVEFNLLHLLTIGNICHQTIFYRASVFEKIGLYDLRFPIVADWDFNIRCFWNPTIKTKYFHRVIVLFNDVTGISSTSRKDDFYAMVPKTYIDQRDSMTHKYDTIVSSIEYKIGKVIHAFLSKIGVVYIGKFIVRYLKK